MKSVFDWITVLYSVTIIIYIVRLHCNLKPKIVNLYYEFDINDHHIRSMNL